MSERSRSHDPWVACPPGEFERMVRRAKRLQRRQMLRQMGSATAVLAAIGLGGYLVGPRLFGSTGQRYGGIACKEVMRLMRDYHEKKLNQELMRKVALHLQECANCGPAYRRMFAAAPPSAQG